ncbi:folate-binding protein [Marmoricola endophyticus]|uniref:Folate-binding protein n=1 Tax=Marmoricola endophyticus TaxID=2040280 RepID=A0A917BHG1_9ACTN|nr:folate-binding protein YgfZ [Marmoricola endophyticus]GGF43756.1 folate-binding protein [Marmoricola endophyticus]
MSTDASPLLSLEGAVAADGRDAGVAAHYGSFHTEQRALVAGEGYVDLSHRGVVRVGGPDRLAYLHSLTTQQFEGLEPGRSVWALVLSPQGHVEHAMQGSDDGEVFTAHVEPGSAPALVDFLNRMRFMMRVEVADVTDEVATVWRRGEYSLLPRTELTTYAQAAGSACGLWAHEALRIERGEPRLGVDTDARSIPNELGWVGDTAHSAVHLDKGCYRGQETVARVHTLGRPPRRLTLLHLDGSENRLPEPGTPLTYDGRASGFVGSAARHHELGPIALGLVKRNVPLDAALDAEGMPVAQEMLVDPEVGMHVRPNLGRS